MNKKNIRQIGTFTLNKKEAIHRWYKYDEGYSKDFIYRELNKIPLDIHTVFEPFSGSGTTPLVASELGIKSYYTESNPFMRFVTNTKTNVAARSIKNKKESVQILYGFLENVEQALESNQYIDAEKISIGGFEKFYHPIVLAKLLLIKEEIDNIPSEDCKDLAKLGLASICVKVSLMKKSGDLRKARPNEKKEDDFNVLKHFKSKIKQIIEDIEQFEEVDFSEAVCTGDDARTTALPEKVDCIITSPPYLNGTNYIINTKLELNMLDFITNESELKNFHSTGIIAGINNVSKRTHIDNNIPELRPYLEELEPVSYDSRLSKMIVGYFNNMNDFFRNSSHNLKQKGYLILDIGDSQFAGVHIPTDKILTIIAQKNGFVLYDEETLRTRRSKNQMLLSQKVMRYQLRGE